MFCHKCGAQMADGVNFCHKCGEKVASMETTPESIDSSRNADNKRQDGIPTIKSEQELANETGFAIDSIIRKEDSESKTWWDSCSKIKKTLIIVAAVPVAILALKLLVSFLREFGYLIFGLLVMAGFFITIFTGTKDEKREAREMIVKMVVGFALIVVVALVVVTKPDLISDFFNPGANVRNAYLTQYSEEVTVEEAFNGFFSDGKWSTYKRDGYSYVVFTGVCEYCGEEADARITFKITGERFRVERLDINGEEQNDLMLGMILAKIYED